MFKQILVAVSLLAMVVPSFADYTEVDCSTEAVFSENSCIDTDQCFLGGSKKQGAEIGLLQDLWKNVTDVPKLVYKESQIDPEMINLDTTNVSWKQSPDANDFWTYTDEFNALYSEDDLAYILPSGESVVWIKSKLSSVYTLDKNTAVEGSNIGLLVYTLSAHNIIDGEVDVDAKEHKECVLFKSGDAGSVTPPVTPTKLPDTGPAEYILLLILSMILGFGALHLRAKA